MAQTSKLKQRLPDRPQQFQEFVFVSESATQLTTNSTVRQQLAQNEIYLHQVGVGKTVKVKQIQTSVDTLRQLKNFNFQVNARVQVLSRTDNGSVIVTGDHISLGISHEIAPKIVVSLIGENK
ncbi:MAG: ferrous iron transport protein A [Cyanobacteria bacterium J06623_7]